MKSDDLEENSEEGLVNNPNLTNSIIRVIGDKSIIRDVIILLAYIRHAIKNGESTKIELNIGKTISGGEFVFDVNQAEIPDLITQTTHNIN